MSQEVKELLGIVPRFIKDDDRQEEIADAMNRFARAGRAIPIEWIDELREITLRRVARFLMEAARDQGKLDAEQCRELQRKAVEAAAYRKADAPPAPPAASHLFYIYKNGELVEAFRMTRERRSDNRDWPNWLNLAWNRDRNEVGAVWPEHYPHSDGKDRVQLRTPQHNAVVLEFGDWIIRNYDGSLVSYEDGWFRRNFKPWHNGQVGLWGQKERAKVCEAAITYPHDHAERIDALNRCYHFHWFNSNTAPDLCSKCGMHRSEYKSKSRSACSAFDVAREPKSARQQLVLWARHHNHEFAVDQKTMVLKCRNCGLTYEEYEEVQWTTLVPCPASLPEGTTEV